MMEPKVAEAAESKLHFLDYWRIVRIRKAVIVTVWLLVVLTSAVVTFVFMKDKYESTVRISVEKEVTDVSSPLGSTPAYTPYDPFWLLTQFEKIQSSSVLNEVIKRRNLSQRWTSKSGSPDRPLTLDETCYLLRKILKVRQYRNTSLIEITVRSEDKEEAVEIANEIATVYRDSRLRLRQELKEGGIKVLERRLEDMNLQVINAQQVVNDMRRTNNITEIGESTLTLHTETLRYLEKMRSEANADYVQYDTLLGKIRQLSREELRATLPTAMPFPDQQLVTLAQDLATAQQKLVSLLQDLSREHPEVKRAQSVVDLLESQVNDRVNGIVQGLETKVASAKARLDEIVASVKEAEIKENEQSAKYRPYFEAKRELEKLLQVRDALKLKIEQESIETLLPVSTAVEIVDLATPGLKPVSPNKPLNILLGLVLGLILGVGLAFFIEYLDTSVKTIDDVERVLQTAVLGVIPQNVGVLLNEGPDHPQAESYRVLRTNILFARKTDGLNTITIVSGGVGEGKSTTLINLAVIFAQNGDRVLVVDSDLRRPSLHKVLKVSNSIGLTNYLLRQNTLDEVIQTTPLEGLHFMPSGKLPSSSMGILSSEPMRHLIRDLKQRYDFVFFDSPPIMGVSDASILAREMDMTLQVIQFRRYPQPMTIRAKQTIQKVGGNLVGIVLNNINMSRDESYYYYSGYYYDYYQNREDDGAGKDAKV